MMEKENTKLLSPTSDLVLRRLADENYLDDFFVEVCATQGLQLELPLAKFSAEHTQCTLSSRKLDLDVLLWDRRDVALNVQMQHDSGFFGDLKIPEEVSLSNSNALWHLAILSFDLFGDVPPIASYQMRWDHDERDVFEGWFVGIVFQLPSVLKSANLDHRLREWALFFNKSQEERVMAELTHPPVLAALRRLHDLSKDELMQSQS